jgi:hypothetical protein
VKTLRLDDVDPTLIDGTLWKPIRSTLGVRAFGVNAYTARAAGDRLFNEHDETESFAGRQRHEELYVVLEGRATFTVDGEEVDAPALTLVFVENPAARRGAVAAAPGTTVLAIGGPVGEAYEPGLWEERFLSQVRARSTT